MAGCHASLSSLATGDTLNNSLLVFVNENTHA